MRSPPHSHVRTTNGVRLWCLDLDRAAEPLARELLRSLAPAERERAARYRSAVAQRRFVVCRGLLRRALGARLAVAPAAIEFTYGTYGKPAAQTPAGDAAAFNVSHSGSLAVIALAPRGSIGVDVERVREVHEADAIVARYFTAHERGRIAAARSAARTRVFARLWTRREAVLKGDGIGLSGLDLPAVEYARLESAYRMRTLCLRRSYVVTVAVARAS